ncbi:MAG: BACON domain-containing protein, partial [Tannerella sp.]|nr:BACON domain-containing protein [Tannerella sp.]
MYRYIRYTLVIICACAAFACKEDYVREIPTLEVDGELSHDVSREGGVYYLTVQASEQFTAAATKIWCKTEILNDVTANNVRITVEPNTGFLRDAEVSIVVYSLPTVKVTIHQDGDDPGVVEPVGPQIAGSWLFGDAANPGKAALGKELTLVGDGFTQVAGPGSSKAVRVASGSHFIADHGIEANGEGLKVNEYTILFDYRLPALDKWYCFLQTNPANGDDGEIFIRPSGLLTNSNIGYSDNMVPQDANWHRLVISCKSPEYCKFYIDGVLFFEGKTTALAKDNRYALDLAGAALFADDDSEDSDIDVAQVTIWDQPLGDADIAALGAVGSTGFLPKSLLTGAWFFNDADNLAAADAGDPLQQVGTGFTAVAGPNADNKAVRIATGSYFLASHGIAPNG